MLVQINTHIVVLVLDSILDSFGVDMSSSVHIDSKENEILILDKKPTQGLNHTLTADT